MAWALDFCAGNEFLVREVAAEQWAGYVEGKGQGKGRGQGAEGGGHSGQGPRKAQAGLGDRPKRWKAQAPGPRCVRTYVRKVNVLARGASSNGVPGCTNGMFSSREGL